MIKIRGTHVHRVTVNHTTDLNIKWIRQHELFGTDYRDVYHPCLVVYILILRLSITVSTDFQY